MRATRFCHITTPMRFGSNLTCIVRTPKPLQRHIDFSPHDVVPIGCSALTNLPCRLYDSRQCSKAFCQPGEYAHHRMPVSSEICLDWQIRRKGAFSMAEIPSGPAVRRSAALSNRGMVGEVDNQRVHNSHLSMTLLCAFQ